jgi:hypothetical protein
MMTYLPTHPTRALRRHFFAFFTTIWVFALAQPCQDATTIQPTTTAKAFNATTTMQTCYVPGASASVSFSITPNSADLNAPRAVVVFDIVSRDEGDTFRSRVLQVIDVGSLSVNPDIFRDSVDMSLVQAGLEGEITFKINDNAPVGNYTMVISVFRLAQGLRPQDVTYDRNALAGRVFYAFRIES